MEGQHEVLLEVQNLKTYFSLMDGTVRAVDGADFQVRRNRTLGIVGESGCGKSVMARSIMRIVPNPGKIVDGHILYHRPIKHNGSNTTTETLDLTALSARGSQIREIRGAEIAMVFQEPMTSLSPVHTIGAQIMEAIILHQKCDKKEARTRAIDILDRVRICEPQRSVDQYPHQLSGGMRQRAMIAMALSCSPNLLIADEPTTALDVTTQAQITELMWDMQKQLGMAIMYITHDLGVIAEMANDVIVMYLGKVVEQTDVVSLFHNPSHPYTRALLRSIPRIGRKSRQRLESIKGVVPDPYSLPVGCPFHPRCPSFIKDVCDREVPGNFEIEPDHFVRCHLYSQQGDAR
jgi:oligopeptide/dipeptide ABC transporter ATP-binding protein